MLLARESGVLGDLMRQHRDELVARCRARVASRGAPRPGDSDEGIPRILDELERALDGASAGPEASISAGRHGAYLLGLGYSVAQVVHHYGDVCQTLTAIAIEREAPISTAEFRALNLCLDNAIAEAVTEYERLRERDVMARNARQSNEHLGSLAHELRNLLGSAMLAYDVLRTGTVGIGGSTGDILGRSLTGLRDVVYRSLTEVRLNAGVTRPELIAVPGFVEDLEVSALLDARTRGLDLFVADVDPTLVVYADRQILASIMSTLLQNAFKYTRPHSRVRLTAHGTTDRVRFDVEDQCGGLAPGKAERLFEPFQQAEDDRTGLGVGLTICARGVRALAGTIHVRNVNRGCVFTVEVPRARA